jgi:hypothetical protein
MHHPGVAGNESPGTLKQCASGLKAEDSGGVGDPAAHAIREGRAEGRIRRSTDNYHRESVVDVPLY